MALNSMIN